MLKEIRAKFACDKCGCLFSVTIDPASKSPEDWSMFEMAEDSLRGVGVEGGVDGNNHLCPECWIKFCKEE